VPTGGRIRFASLLYRLGGSGLMEMNAAKPDTPSALCRQPTPLLNAEMHFCGGGAGAPLMDYLKFTEMLRTGGQGC